MQDNVVNFIRDRFESLETNMNEGFKDVKVTMREGFSDHEERLKSLETCRAYSRGKIVAYSTVSSGVFSILIFIAKSLF